MLQLAVLPVIVLFVPESLHDPLVSPCHPSPPPNKGPRIRKSWKTLCYKHGICEGINQWVHLQEGERLNNYEAAMNCWSKLSFSFHCNRGQEHIARQLTPATTPVLSDAVPFSTILWTRRSLWPRVRQVWQSVHTSKIPRNKATSDARQVLTRANNLARVTSDPRSPAHLMP